MIDIFHKYKGEQAMVNHIAVDIGASSGRLVHGALVDGQLRIRELHRFGNRFERVNGHDYWDVDH